MGEAQRTNERATPTSVTFRPARRLRTTPLWGLLPSISLLVTNGLGGLSRVLGVVFVLFIVPRWADLESRYVVMTRDALTQRRSFRVRTFPWSALTLHEKGNRIDIRHDRRLVLRLPRRQDKLEEMYEPSVPWDVTLESTESFLEAAFPDVAERRRQVAVELRAARHDRGLTQRAVAARIGTTPSVVAQVESADTDVGPSTLRRYASAVGRSLDWQLRDD